jgi:hypothetical protein
MQGLWADTRLTNYTLTGNTAYSGDGGADLDNLGDVDYYDLDLLADEWLDYCPYDWPLR